MKNSLLVVFVYILLSCLAYSMIIDDEIKIISVIKDRQKVIGKFGYEIGTGTYHFSFNLNQSAQGNSRIYVKLAVFDYDSWEKAESVYDCSKKSSYASKIHDFVIPRDTGVVNITDRIFQTDPNQVWFFVLFDCSKNLNLVTNKQTMLQIKGSILNENGSHFSFEEKGFLPFYFILLFASFYLLITITYYNLTHIKNQNSNYPNLLLNLCALTLLAYFLCKIAHVWTYQIDGKGIPLLNTAALSLQIITEYIIVSTLILISWGWTIIYFNNENYDLFIPLLVVGGAIQIILICISKVMSAHTCKYHEYDGFWGWTIIAIRIIMLIIFSFGVSETRKKKKYQDANRIFFTNLGIYGALYFLSFPFILISALVISPEHRYKYVEILTLTSTAAAIYILSNAFTNKKGSYVAVTLLNLGLPSIQQQSFQQYISVSMYKQILQQLQNFSWLQLHKNLYMISKCKRNFFISKFQS